LGCVGPMALRLTDLEAKIRGVVPSDSRKIIRESKAYLKKTLEPIDDLLGSAEYKVYIAGVLLERALAQALENVGKKQDGRNG
jgi:CO/xanthine dehydrogenase FAD-binding subunit